jgi:protocatechuate 3,4-dioxygenase beta subunit
MQKLNRRDLLLSLGSSGILALAGSTGYRPRPIFGQATCTLTPQQTEGPYWFNANQVRSDITEGKAGVSLRVALRVVSASTCLPIPNAVAEIWHADAGGIYSGYAAQGTAGQTFLRGIQVTDAHGLVEFQTIYPGWYRGRTTHIHFKVHFENQTLVTSQLYFPETISNTIYTTVSPYSTRGAKDTANASDMVYSGGGDQTLVQVQQDGSGYLASLTISIAANAATEFVSWVPVVLSSSGLAGSIYTSELAITNRAATAATVGFSYTAASGGGSGSVSGALVLPPGQQQIVPNAIEYLRTAGIPIPSSGARVGVLAVRFSGISFPAESSVIARTTTAVPGGRAGVAYSAVPSDGLLTAAYLCGLRQNTIDRSNVAFQNLGTEGNIVLRVTVFSGEGATVAPVALPDVTLAPGGFFQYSGVLEMAGFSNGYVRVEPISGRAPYYAYGVINDQVNSDGSFVFPVIEIELYERRGQSLPVIVETPRYSTELTLTNFSSSSKILNFSFVAEAVETSNNTANFQVTLQAGEQKILPRIVNALRQQAVAGIGAAGTTFAGALFATVSSGDMSGIVIGARTLAPGGGGQYGLFYNAVPYGSASTSSAWLYGLQQTAETRSNVALVNTSESDGSTDIFSIDIYDGGTGVKVIKVEGVAVAAKRWLQINSILALHAPGVSQGYAQVKRTSGNNPFITYAVINDGGQPGERSGDGAFVASSS